MRISSNGLITEQRMLRIVCITESEGGGQHFCNMRAHRDADILVNYKVTNAAAAARDN